MNLHSLGQRLEEFPYLSTVDKGSSHLSLGEHGRRLDIVPVFTGEGIDTENVQQFNITSKV